MAIKSEKGHKMALLQNNTKGTIRHGNFIIKAGEVLEVPKKVAEIWLKIKGIVEYVDPKEAKEAIAKATDAYKALKAEFDKLKEAHDKLKAELATLKKSNK
jgi:predicted  nucleic acid-binding Zn-ribbon protein